MADQKYVLRVGEIVIEAATRADAEAVLETKRVEQRAKEERFRDVRGDVFATREEADAACQAHDKALGLPNAHMERWTIPIELDDGTYLVQSPRGEKGDAIGVKRIKVVPE